ncbi:ORF6C domain-containing protein [Ligilactobacillus salivarius]|uniref:ORF6C domain-containing protein n=1 Tax=Ligilactobacillus salivarius TaxID=1624 RepID=UPI003F273675
MNELIKITKDDNGNSVVSGRDLHDFLEVKTAYKDWFPRMCEYGFTDGKDFSSILSESTGGRPRVDHAMTLDMAKEISMIQRTERGKQARQYFIDVEKEYKKQIGQSQFRLPKNLTEMSTMFFDVMKDQDKKIEEQSEKVNFLMNLSGLTSPRNKELTKARNKKIIQVCGGSESNSYQDKSLRSKLYNELFKSYRHRFDVNQYVDTPMKRFDEAKDYINNWYPPFELKDEIEKANAQGNLF